LADRVRLEYVAWHVDSRSALEKRGDLWVEGPEAPRRGEAVSPVETTARSFVIVPPQITKFEGPFFTYPFVNGATRADVIDGTIHARLGDLFDGLTSDTVVRGAIYTWNFAPFDELVGAQEGPVEFTEKILDLVVERRADAEFIVDSNFDAASQDPAAGAGSSGGVGTADAVKAAFADRGIPLHVDEGIGVQHAKYFLFSELHFPEGSPAPFPRDMRHVVAVLSLNVTSFDFYSTGNMIVMHGNEELYDAFFDLWNYTKVVQSPTGYAHVKRDCGDVKLYSFPVDQPPHGDTGWGWLNWIVSSIGIPTDFLEVLADWARYAVHPTDYFFDIFGVGIEDLWELFLAAAEKDPVADEIRQIIDLMPLGGAHTKIRFAHSYWDREAVIQGLMLASWLGADVKVLTGDPVVLGVSYTAYAAYQLKAGFIDVRYLPTNAPRDGDMHHKYFLVDATYDIRGDSRIRKLVFTGSHNLHYDSLEADDEVMVRIENRSVYNAYLDDWNRLWADARSW